MKLNYKRVYVTGSDGWLGKCLVNCLLNGDKEVLQDFIPTDYHLHTFVYDANAEPSKIAHQNTNLKTVFSGDLTSKKDCAVYLSSATEEDLLIHTAGVIHPKKVKDFFEINVNGTKNIVEAAIERKVSKIIVLSSNSPIGCNSSNNPKDLFDENSLYNPYMNYGKSKMVMEKYLLSKMEDSIDITILRPPWFYGDYMPKRQLTFYKMIRDGKFPRIGNGENIRSMVHVKNLCQGIILAATNPISKGQVYWIADETPYSMNKIVSVVRSILEELKIPTKKPIIKLPFFVGQIAELIDSLFQKIGIYNQQIHVVSELNKNISCSIAKAQKELKYTPIISLWDGTKSILEKYLDHLK